MDESKRKWPKGTPTQVIRLPVELVEKLNWISQIRECTVSDIVMPMIEDKVNEIYGPLIPLVKEIELAKAEFRKVRDKLGA